ncbi:uncharacterized protein LOC143020923 isoform X1 [Oratosquilla oratoria]|uniref:uncharacterized protein LOC143020923 isoform X1 n=1 Tax=Oratosquilla oratoria TaxID=337810 RepID=UPI003F75F1DD
MESQPPLSQPNQLLDLDGIEASAAAEARSQEPSTSTPTPTSSRSSKRERCEADDALEAQLKNLIASVNTSSQLMTQMLQQQQQQVSAPREPFIMYLGHALRNLKDGQFDHVRLKFSAILHEMSLVDKRPAQPHDGEIEMDPLEKVEEDIQDGSQLSSSPEMNGEAGSAFHGDGLSLHPKKLEQSIGTPELSMECTLSELPGMPSSAVAPENNNDDAHFMGALVECELRAMNARQKCFVKKLISDAIYYGNLQMLCHASHIVCQPDNSQQDIKFPQQT